MIYLLNGTILHIVQHLGGRTYTSILWCICENEMVDMMSHGRVLYTVPVKYWPRRLLCGTYS